MAIRVTAIFAPFPQNRKSGTWVFPGAESHVFLRDSMCQPCPALPLQCPGLAIQGQHRTCGCPGRHCALPLLAQNLSWWLCGRISCGQVPGGRCRLMHALSHARIAHVACRWLRRCFADGKGDPRCCRLPQSTSNHVRKNKWRQGYSGEVGLSELALQYVLGRGDKIASMEP